jgi:hypothetical protein
MSNANTDRSDNTRAAERASRYRRQDAIADLKRLLELLPRERLQGYLSFTDPLAVLPRLGIPETHAIKIVCAIIMYVMQFGLQLHYVSNLLFTSIDALEPRVQQPPQA